jgi:hypothetical protein
MESIFFPLSVAFLLKFFRFIPVLPWNGRNSQEIMFYNRLIYRKGRNGY